MWARGFLYIVGFVYVIIGLARLFMEVPSSTSDTGMVGALCLLLANHLGDHHD